MDLLTRLKSYIEYTGLQLSQFADLAQIPRPTLSQILSGRNKKISNELIEKLHVAFPKLNITWLLFGDGEMEDDIIISSKSENRPNFPTIDKVPELNFSSQPQNTTPKDELKAKEMPQSNIAHNATAFTVASDSPKRIQTIMVFYTDNSFEIFEPAQK